MRKDTGKRRNVCKACYKAEKEEYRAAHRVELEAKQREYRAAHRVERAAKQREYYAAHRAERMEYNREYYETRRAELMEHNREYYGAHRAEQAEYQKQYRQTHKVEQAARDAVKKAIKEGVLKRTPCEICGSTTRVEGHHDDYSQPLDVRWLCRSHHSRLHAALKGTLCSNTR